MKTGSPGGTLPSYLRTPTGRRIHCSISGVFWERKACSERSYMNREHVDNPEAPRIVNVDDHESARYLRTRLLQRAGYWVLEASSAAMALECVRRVKPDLVLLDVNLPDGSGI